MHWLLLARTIVTGQAGAAETGGVAVGTEGGDGGRTAGEGGSSGLADDSANPTGARDDSDDDDDDGGGGSGAGSGVGGGGGALIGYMGVAVQTRQVAAAAAITGTTANYGPGCPPRWQVKHAAVQLASQALSIAARHARLEVDNGAKNKNKKQQYATIVTASCHMDVAMARASVASALAAYGNPSTSTDTSSFVAFPASSSSSSSSSQSGGDDDFGSFASFEAFPQSPDAKKGGVASPPNTAFSPSSSTAASLAAPTTTTSSIVRFDDVAAYSALPDYCALHLEALIGTACAAATHTLGDTELGVSSLQAGGLQLLAATVQLFKGCQDPDAVNDSNDSNGGADSGVGTPVLGQFTSQVASAFRPSLVALHKPRLVHTGANALCVATAYGLVTDPGRLKRLLHVLLPPGYYQSGGGGKGAVMTKKGEGNEDSAMHSSPQHPLGPLRMTGEGQGNQLGASTSDQVFEHVSRLLALADLLILAAAPLPTTAPEGRGSTPTKEVVATALPSAVAAAVKTTLLDDEQVVASLVAAWGALLSDALRLKQGDGNQQEEDGGGEYKPWWPSSSSPPSSSAAENSAPRDDSSSRTNRSRTASSSSVSGRGAETSGCGPGLLFGAPSDVTPATKRLLLQRWPAAAAALSCAAAHFSAPEPTDSSVTSSALNKKRTGAAGRSSKAPPASLGAILPLCGGACLAALLEPMPSSSLPQVSSSSEREGGSVETTTAAVSSSSSFSSSSGVSGSGLELCLLVVHTLWCNTNACAHLHAYAAAAAAADENTNSSDSSSSSDGTLAVDGAGESIWPPPAAQVVPSLLRALTLKTLSPAAPYSAKLRGLALLRGLLLSSSSSSSSSTNDSGKTTWLRDAIPVEAEVAVATNEEAEVVAEDEGKASDNGTAHPSPEAAPEGAAVAVVDEEDWGDDDEWDTAPTAAADDAAITSASPASLPAESSPTSSDTSQSVLFQHEGVWWEGLWEQAWRQWADGKDTIDFALNNGASDNASVNATATAPVPADAVDAVDVPTLEDAASSSLPPATTGNSETTPGSPENDDDDDDDDEFGAFGTDDEFGGDFSSSSSSNEIPAAVAAADEMHEAEWGTENNFNSDKTDDKNNEDAGSSEDSENNSNDERSAWSLLLATVAMPVSQLTPYSLAVNRLMGDNTSKDNEPTNSDDVGVSSDEMKAELGNNSNSENNSSNNNNDGGGAVSLLMPSALANVPLACDACPPSRRCKDLPSVLSLLLKALLSTALAHAAVESSSFGSDDSSMSERGSGNALVAVRSAGAPAYAAVANMIAAQLPSASAQSLLATSALYAARAAGIVATVLGDYSAAVTFAPPKTSSEKALHARRVQELETCHALCLDVWMASQHANFIFCADAFQTAAMPLGRRQTSTGLGASINGGNDSSNAHESSPAVPAPLRKTLAASLVRALQETLQAEKAASAAGSSIPPSTLAARKRKAQQFCAALSPLALALVYESSSSSSGSGAQSSSKSQVDEGEDAVSIELVKGLLLHAQAADSLAGPGATTALLGLLLPLCAALLAVPSPSMGTALKSVLTRAVLHLAQSCPDGFRAQVMRQKFTRKL